MTHLIWNNFEPASKKDRGALKRNVKPIYGAGPNAARAALNNLTEKRDKKSGAIIRFWDAAWGEFIPFMHNDVNIRTTICYTNATEHVNPRWGQAVQAPGHFRPEKAALKYLGISHRKLPARDISSLDHSIDQCSVCPMGGRQQVRSDAFATGSQGR